MIISPPRTVSPNAPLTFSAVVVVVGVLAFVFAGCSPGKIERMNTAPRDRGGGDPTLLYDSQPDSQFCLAKEEGYFRPVAVLYVWFTDAVDFNHVRIMTDGWPALATVDCNLQNSAPDFVEATPATRLPPLESGDKTQEGPHGTDGIGELLAQRPTRWQVFTMPQSCKKTRRAALKLRVPEQLVTERLCFREVDFGKKSWGVTLWMN